MRSTPPGPTTTPGTTPVKLDRVSEQTAPDHRDRSETSGDEASTADRLRHGSSFGAAAAAYAEHRPGYAEAAVRWALEPVGNPPSAGVRVADVGAGTGKLTATLVSLGAQVTAVEPDPQMLAELRRTMPAVRSVPGSAEEIPLPDASLDAVLAGQAMHWFDMDRALPEIARVLRPGGVLAGLWNTDDDRVGWVAGLAEISKRKSSITLTRWRDGAGQSRQQRLVEEGSGLFEAAEVAEFGHGQVRTADSLLATIGTHSHLLVMDEAERIALLARVDDFLRSQPETARGEFTLPMVTVVLRARRPLHLD
jgi:SAM-dependent methyltransferase